MRKLMSIFVMNLMPVFALAMSGCSALGISEPLRSEEMGDSGTIYLVPSERRILEVHARGSDAVPPKDTDDVSPKSAGYVVCSEPFPDIAMSTALKLAQKTSGNELSQEASRSALPLEGRTQVVLLAREFIASNCRARANHWINNDTFESNQEKILEQIAGMIAVDKSTSEAQAKLADDKKAQAETQAKIAEAEARKAEAEAK